MTRTNTFLVIVVGLLFLLPILPVTAHAQVPQSINYQGKLTDADGVALDGFFLVSFYLYDYNQSSDTPIWQDESVTVEVRGGIYNVQLALTADLFNSDELYLEVAIFNASTGWETLSPRQIFTSTPFAMKAADADTLHGHHPTAFLSSMEPGTMEASSDDSVLTVSNTGNGDGISVSATGTYGTGVYGEASGTEGWGVLGAATGLWGIGVYGIAMGTNGLGVLGTTDGGWGVRGEATDTGDVTNYGGYFSAAGTTGTAVYGEATNTGDDIHYGGYFMAAGTHGIGVLGDAPGTYGRGVVGAAAGTHGWGVYGSAQGTFGGGVYGGASNTGGVENYGGYFTAAGTFGHGVHGEATGAEGTGVWGLATGSDGRGVYGEATGTNGLGVLGTTDGSDGRGVYGEATNTGEGLKYGGYFIAAGRGGRGVYGEATGDSDVSGVYGYATGTYGSGVHGDATGTNGLGVIGTTSGTNGWGVYGSASGSDGLGVYGYATGTEGTGVYGEATNMGDDKHYGGYFSAAGSQGRGVYGSATNTEGAYNYGGYFTAAGTSGRGVYGSATNTEGAYNYGGYFTAAGTSGWGVYGGASTTNGTGVYGYGGKYDFYAGNTGYGPFTGAHEVRFAEDMPNEIRPGMIVSVTGRAEARKKEDGKISLSSTLPTVTLSQKGKDKAVLGVLVSEGPLPKDHWYEAQEGERFGVVNALGEGRVWVSNSKGAIAAGDYITTSSIAGYGQKQHDDLLHSYTLGKAIETVDWDSVTEVVESNGQTFKIYLIAVVYTSG